MKSIRKRDAVLLPGEASTLLSVIAFLFISSGVLLLLAIAVLLVGKLAGWEMLQSIPIAPLGVGVNALYGAGHCWIGALLLAAKRRGAYFALGLSGLQLTSAILSPPVTAGSLVFPVLVILAVLLAWPHLTVAGRDLAAPTSIARRTS